ncbi:MAG: hypothetical protein KUG68_02200 [Flavobacteriaceae bacterium]|nr:hypothetical protein [Flavobacteriaceae bacterium]
MDKKATPITMLIIALIIFTILFIYLLKGEVNEQSFWLVRVLTALSAAGISMSLSGTINIGTKENIRTLAEKEPKITAAGSLAIFVIVYLFNPISF